MIVRKWSKSHTQSAIKVLRAEGYLVEKTSAGYECIFNGLTIFYAIAYPTNFVVNYDQNLYL